MHHILATICCGVCATQASISIGEPEIHALYHQSSHTEAANIQTQDVSQLPHKQTGHDYKGDVESTRHRLPQRNRLLIKDKETTTVDDIISTGIVGTRKMEAASSTLDSGPLIPIIEDDGDIMLEIINEEYLELPSYNDDGDDDHYVAIDGPTVGGYDEVSDGLTFTTATDIITTELPSRPPSGVWDDVISTDATLPWATSTEQPPEDVILTTTTTTDYTSSTSEEDTIASNCCVVVQGESCLEPKVNSASGMLHDGIKTSLCCENINSMEFNAGWCPGSKPTDAPKPSPTPTDLKPFPNEDDLICSCSPHSYTIRLSLTQLCDINDLEDNVGITETICVTSVHDVKAQQQEDGTIYKKLIKSSYVLSNDELKQITILDVQFIEFDRSGKLIVINQNSEYENVTVKNDESHTLASVTKKLNSYTPLNDQLEYIPGGIQIALRGSIDIEEDGKTTEKIVNQHVTWSYNNQCDGNSLPVIESGDRIGWIMFVSFILIHGLFCVYAYC